MIQLSEEEIMSLRTTHIHVFDNPYGIPCIYCSCEMHKYPHKEWYLYESEYEVTFNKSYPERRIKLTLDK